MKINKTFEIVFTVEEVEVILKDYVRNMKDLKVNNISFELKEKPVYGMHPITVLKSVICSGDLGDINTVSGDINKKISK